MPVKARQKTNFYSSTKLYKCTREEHTIVAETRCPGGCALFRLCLEDENPVRREVYIRSKANLFR